MTMVLKLCTRFVVAIALLLVPITTLGESPFSWECDSIKQTCSKILTLQSTAPLDFMECKMTCSDVGTLWPLPTNLEYLSKTLATFNQVGDIGISRCDCDASTERLVDEFFNGIFLEYLWAMRAIDSDIPAGPSSQDSSKVDVTIVVEQTLEPLTTRTNESYSLVIGSDGKIPQTLAVDIHASTYFGARHAMETLSQLISWNTQKDQFQIHEQVFITDTPYLPHRGISVDTARQFIPVQYLKKVLDGMSFNKLNTFHWHLSDSQSFPVELPSFPQMAQYGAYYQNEVYTANDILDLVEYATLRGIRVIPELDGPRHAANGWQFGELEGLGTLAFCINDDEVRCRGGVCGLLNPINPNLYVVLEGIFRDLRQLIPSDQFHLGADEVVFDCWNKSTEIQTWMQEQGMTGTKDDFYALWQLYQTKTLQTLIRANEGQKMKATVWTSSLTKRDNFEEVLPIEDYVVQIWTNHDEPTVLNLVNKGYEVILSHEDMYYLGCGQGSWGDKAPAHCDPFKQWRDIYDFDPTDNYLAFEGSQANRLKQILGAELGMWMEQTYGPTLEAQIFPRSAAFAERLWTKPTSNWTQAEIRFIHQRQRIVERGVIAEAVQMYWCHQNEGRCRVFGDPSVPEP